MHLLNSDVLHAVGYQPDEKLLIVQFRNGAIYQYRGVPKIVHDDLLSSTSPGSFFNRHIRHVFTVEVLRMP